MYRRDFLRRFGYVDGTTLRFELRYGEGDLEKYAHYAKELVDLPVDVLVTSNTDALRAMKRGDGRDPHRPGVVG